MENKKKCEWCGRAYTPLHIATQRYCSIDCRKEAETARNNLKNMRGGEIRECLFCGKKFVASSAKGWHCSPACTSGTLDFHAQLAEKKA